MTGQSDMESGKLAITNSESFAVVLVIEPWAEERTILPCSTVILTYTGPAGGQLEIERKPEKIIIYGWPGSRVAFLEG